MRWLVLHLVCLGLVGCATRPVSETGAEPVLVEAQAAALLFDPPVALGQQRLDLDRSGRSEAAFWGLAGPSVTHHFIVTDDRFGTRDWGRFDGDHYRRRSVIVQWGSSVR